MDNNQIIQILELKSIAIVGLSKKHYKPSYQIFKYLNRNGYNTIPVNPRYQFIENKECYSDLELINKPVDIVNIFRKPEYVLPIIKSAIKINAKAIWMQDGVINKDAFEAAKNAGLLVVMNDCILRRHQEISMDLS
tara:strand:+ start:288 stop:695 length:408 start_codon:yes stop_codon:yes gene_type:complete